MSTAPGSNDTTVYEGDAGLDLASLGIKKGTYPCRVVFDSIGRVDRLEVTLPNSRALLASLINSSEQFRDQVAHVTLGDGRTIDAVLAIAGGLTGNLLGDVIVGIFYVDHSTMHCPSVAPPDRWRILLVNAHVDGYDYGVTTTTDRGWSYNPNEIRFRVAGREWTLVDDLSLQWESQHGPDVTKPVPGVRLETPAVGQDSLEDIERLASDLESLLTLALGRSVSWYCIQRLANGAVVGGYDARRWVAPYGRQPQIISNASRDGTLKGFLEAAYDAFVADREWLTHTILQFVASLSASHVEIRMSLQNTLLDRISSHILRHDDTFEIDSGLPERLSKSFRRRLHELLQDLSPYWPLERTALVTQNIEEWNSGPSFPGAVERAAVRLGLWPPKKSQIRKRHKLIHEGEYDASDGTNPFDYWMRIECLVVMFILRLLGYSGRFRHVAVGRDDIDLAAIMVGGSSLPPYDVDPQTHASLYRLVEMAAYLHWCGRNRADDAALTDWLYAERAVTALAPMRRNEQ